MKILTLFIALFLSIQISAQPDYFYLSQPSKKLIEAHSNLLSRTPDNFFNKPLLNGEYLFKEQIFQRLSNNWENDWKRVFVFDAHNNVIEKLLLDGGFTAWVNTYRISLSYDADNFLVEEVGQDWSNYKWVNEVKFTHTYHDNMMESYAYSWRDSAWNLGSRYIYTYDNDKKLIHFLSQMPAGPEWRNYIKITNSYDSNDNIVEQFIDSWDGYSQWLRNHKISYIYNSDGTINKILQHFWYFTDWMISDKITYSYDEQGILKQSVSTRVYPTIERDEVRTFYSFDAGNYLVDILEQTWDGYKWVNKYKYVNSYIPTPVDNAPALPNTFTLADSYPNPFNPSASIRYTIPEPGTVSLKIFDVLGNEIQTLVNQYQTAGTYTAQFTASGLPSGIYLYRLTSGTHTAVKKMLLLK